jgi:hypothetical protein
MRIDIDPPSDRKLRAVRLLADRIAELIKQGPIVDRGSYHALYLAVKSRLSVDIVEVDVEGGYTIERR